MNYVVEKDWITKAGLRAAVIFAITPSMKWRCGYVAVGPEHPAYGKKYNEQLPEITKEQAANTPIGLKSPMLMICCNVDADDENSIRRSLDIIIDVHGGLTYSSHKTPADSGYPVYSVNSHWFGFDTSHFGDDIHNGGQPLDYCIEQCESMAEQLAAIKPLALPAPAPALTPAPTLQEKSL